MNKDFELFQTEFRKWQQRFGLTGYKIYFKHEEIDGAFAKINIDLDSMRATVRLNNKLPDTARPHKDIKGNAKHEALHLLISRLELNGKYRYASANEMDESAEDLVHKLEGLIE